MYNKFFNETKEYLNRILCSVFAESYLCSEGINKRLNWILSTAMKFYSKIRITSKGSSSILRLRSEQETLMFRASSHNEESKSKTRETKALAINSAFLLTIPRFKPARVSSNEVLKYVLFKIFKIMQIWKPHRIWMGLEVWKRKSMYPPKNISFLRNLFSWNLMLLLNLVIKNTLGVLL